MAVGPDGKTVNNTYNFHPDFVNRSDAINEIGRSQNNYIAETAQRNIARRQAENAAAMAAAQAKGQANVGSMSGTVTGGSFNEPAQTSTNNFQSFRTSIAAQETGGEKNPYTARNPSGAMGKYQVMPSNFLGTGKGWDFEALGRDISSAQFLASPKLQEQIATYKLQSYYNKYGAAGAAIAWYAGPTAAQRFVKTGSVGGSKAYQADVRKYTTSVLGRMGSTSHPALKVGAGYKAQMAAINTAFPSIRATSTFRPGAITSSGNVSFHASGRAVDLPASQALFNWLVQNYGATSKEIIWTPAGGRQIKNGRTYTYGSEVAKGHVGHIHWAY